MIHPVPQNWQEVRANDICSLITNGFVGKATSHYTQSEDGVLYIQGYNVKENGFEFRGIKKVTREFHEKNRKSQLKKWDLLTIQTGDVGLTTIVPKSLEGSNCHALIISRFIAEKAYPPFMAQFYNSPFGRMKLKKIEFGSTMKHINISALKKLKLSLPPLPEQRRIVNVLETWDEAIKKLERKIDMKKYVRKGLMQKLLNGRTRLPGFTEKWKLVKLGDLVERVKRKNSVGNSNVLTISAQDGLVNQGAYFSKQIASKNLEKYTLLEKGDFAYNKSYSQGYPMGAIKRLKMYESGVVSSLYICFKCKGKVDTNFLDFYFDAGLFNQEIGKVAQEGARNHGLLNIGVDEFFDGELRIPDLKEQQAIANMLLTSEAEISLLEQSLKKLKEQKAYLLNHLITGRIRTPENMPISKS